GWAEVTGFLDESFGGGRSRCVVLPALEAGADADEVRSFDIACDRLDTLTRMASLTDSSERLVVFTTPAGLFSPVERVDALRRDELLVRRGSHVSFKTLVEALGGRLGYDHESVCDTPGQFSVRGGLVDVYPYNGDAPLRIDFFGDEVESIRRYDPATQRSIDAVESATIAPLSNSSSKSSSSPLNILGYLGSRVDWFFEEPDSLAQSAPDLFNTFERGQGAKPCFEDVFKARQDGEDRWYGIAALGLSEELFGCPASRLELRAEATLDHVPATAEGALGIDRVNAEQRARASLMAEVSGWIRDGWRVVFVSGSEGEDSRIRAFVDTLPDWKGLNVAYLIGPLRHGFRIGGEGFGGDGDSQGVAFLPSAEVFGTVRPRPAGSRRRLLARKTQVDQALDFGELAPGDPLVHLSHGICLYRGLAKMQGVSGIEEVITLEFADGLLLHLPLHEAHLLTRYVGLTKRSPKLGKVGGAGWDKARAAAERATLDFAAQMLRMQAVRDTGGGFAFAPDEPLQEAFERAFPFQETPDQQKAIDETKADMEKPLVMDRLICGDVGFGKTEVALRAAFKAVINGRQVAILAPTTVLAQQHFNTFRERLAEFPIAVEMLSRFRSAAQQGEIVRQLAEGRVDIVIGTHRVLGQDVKFKNLGLLVVDEEHRFGVRHKERIKEMSVSVDVLTMSATPIPRTLYLALMGARSLSVIETPPVDRLPIQTIVKSYSLDVIKEAIGREIERGGQVFYLHNRVQSIDSVAEQLSELMPDLRIGVGHGQMDELALERVMTKFVAGEYDVLVCTTIIESGLDIPNCNTIIIEGADRFGLAQLYQLRGRVGRFKRQAYAYLLLHKHAKMLDPARKRLAALKQHRQLGAGYRIAMRDLELRGAGNLIGTKQSGHIAGVGFDLYCQLLRQSIARLKGERGADLVRANLRLDFIIEGEKPVEHEGDSRLFAQAYIPADYVNEAELRIRFYRELAMCASPGDVDSVAEAMRDRFGPLPSATLALIEVTRVRTLAEQAGVRLVETEGDILRCTRASGRKDDYIKTGNRFPRLTARNAALRLREICSFLRRHSKEAS
ncbi:MAG: transcription-repair coupling factor, partial [Opitutales bacterium]|nr:transcription-repair coupling factor [Opitutales bacterium]